MVGRCLAKPQRIGFCVPSRKRPVNEIDLEEFVGRASANRRPTFGRTPLGIDCGHPNHLLPPDSKRSSLTAAADRPLSRSSRTSAESPLNRSRSSSGSPLTLVRIREGLPILAFRCSSAERSVEFGQRGLARSQLSLIQIDERFLGQP